MIEILKKIYNKYEEIINYLIVGVLTTAVSLTTKYALLFTVLNAKDALQLQISVVVSWIVAVLFAYITNRKYVFKSKNKNIGKEIIKFFSARIATLIMESVILWFFITFLKMNSKMQVIIWTLVAQVLIMIGNYVLSKIFVFNKKNEENKINILNKNNIFNIALFIILTIICYIFPYTHDDWAWGSIIGMDRLNTLFHNYNGRWAGNLLVLALTRSRISRAFVISITLTLIVYVVKKNVEYKNKSNNYIFIILMLLMPVNIIAQSIAWTSGFTNYVIPVLIVLIIMYLNRNIFFYKEVIISNILIIPLLVLGFCCSLFVEHMTIYNVLLSICIVLYLLIAKKKISWANISYALGSIAGTILMFSNGAYHAIANSEDTYRTIEKGNIFERAINTYFNTFYKLFIQNNTVINMFIGGIILYLIFIYLQKKKSIINKNKKVLLYIIISILTSYISYNIFIKVVGNSYILANNTWNKYLEATMAIVYYISILISIFIIIEDRSRKFRLMFELISIIIIATPLLIVTPIGPRCFFPTYVFFALFAIDCFDYSIGNVKFDISNILKISIVVIMIFFGTIFGQVYKIDNKRIEYINIHNNDKELILPKLPYENYMQVPNPQNEVFYERFKLFYGINKDSSLKFIPYKQWKKGQ